MQLDIPDDIMQSSGLTEAECMIELGVHLYAARRISLRQALRLSGLDLLAFEQHLARRNITLYTLDDLREDVDTLKALGRW